MDRDDLLLGVGGLVIAGLSYFAGVVRTNRHRDADDSEARITRVLDKYIAAAQAAKTNGFHGLVYAGVGNLKNDAEIRELLDRISKYGQNWDPRKQLEGIDLHEFFQSAIQQKLNFTEGRTLEMHLAKYKKVGG